MAGGSSFLHRVIQYVANELIVDRLANNQSFQRFAVRSSKAIEDLTKKGKERSAELVNQVKDFTETVKDEVSRSMKDGRK